MYKKHLGYDCIDGKVVINEEESEIVKFIFDKYVEYNQNPPSVLVENLIEDYAARGEELTYDEAKSRVSEYSIECYILDEVKERWPNVEQHLSDGRVQYRGKTNGSISTPLIDKGTYEKLQLIMKKKDE